MVLQGIQSFESFCGSSYKNRTCVSAMSTRHSTIELRSYGLQSDVVADQILNWISALDKLIALDHIIRPRG